MKICLRERTEETVAIYFTKAQDVEIKKVLPQIARTLEETLEDYHKTQLPNATSYGRTIYADDIYVGDIWCYAINMDEEPNAMLSYCIFEKEYWGQGVATKAVKLFLEKIIERFHFMTIGAFSYTSNPASIRVLEKNGFLMQEEFVEDGIQSQYFQRKCMTMSEDVLKNICEHYGIEDVCIGSFFDTSHGEEDIRYRYVISQKYVLKMNTAEMVTEGFLQGINQLVEKYRDIGVWCPKILANKEEKLLYQLEQDGRSYHCYVEEYAPYEIAKGKVDSEYALKEEMLAHVGKLAAKYSGKDLRKTYSMWSIIDLAPLDVEVDEKQENMNALVEALQKHGYDAEAEEVIRVNIACRDHIMKYFDLLPRCVYQGDLNRSNILIDKNKHFTGIIDFNMYGTEVNVNCFLNESMYYLDEQDFETMTATELFERMNEVQKKLLMPIFKYYILNEVEKKVYRDYKKIIDLCFYPNVMLWIYLIENHKYEDKVIQLIRFLTRDKGQIES